MGAAAHSGRTTVREWFIVTAGYIALTVLLTYPVAFRLTTHFMGDGYDGFQNIWNFWWVRKSIFELRNPYFTDYLFHPTGSTLLFHTLNPFNALLSIPLQSLCNMETTYNLVALFTFVATGVGMYAFVRYLTNQRAAAFVAGIIFTFCHYRMGHSLGHLNLMSTEWIPIYALSLLRTIEGNRWTNVLLTAGSLVLCWFCSEHYVVYLLLFTGLYLITRRATSGPLPRGSLQRITITLVLFSIVTSFVWIPMLITLSRESFTANVHDPYQWSTDLLSYFVPGEMSTYGETFKPVWSRFSGNTAEGSNYAGYVAAALALYGSVRFRECRVWAIATLTFLILALGPELRAGGKATSIPLPYALLNKLPILSFSGVPERFNVMVMFGIAVLAGFAIQEICQQARTHRTSQMRAAMVGLAVVVEYLAIPYPMVRLPVPSVYQRIASEPGDFAFMDLPMNAPKMYFQTVHQKRLVHGYISRPPEEVEKFVRENVVLAHLSGEPLEENDGIRNEALRLFAENRIRFIVSHGGWRQKFIEQKLGLPVHWEEGNVRVYRTESE